MLTPLLPIVLLGTAFVGLTLLYRPQLSAPVFGLAMPLAAVTLPGGIYLVQLLSLVLIGVAILTRLEDGLTPLPLNWPVLMATVWSLGVIASTTFSDDLSGSLILGAWQIAAALLAVAWAELTGSPQRLRPALMAWLVGSVVVGLTGVVGAQGLQASYGGAVVSGRAQGIFSQPNEYGFYCMVTVIFALGVAVLTRGWLRRVAILSLAVCSVGLLLSLSRGAWTGTAVGVVVLVVAIPQTRRPVAIGLLAIVGALATLWVAAPNSPLLQILVERVLSIGDRGANPYDNRPTLVAEGIRQWLSAPVFGHGPNSYPRLASGVESMARPEGAEHAHNLWVTLGAEQGLIGVAAMIGFGVVVVATAHRFRPRVVAAHRAGGSWLGRGERAADRSRATAVSLPAAVTLSAACSLSSILVEGLADYPLRNAIVRNVMWVMIGWVLAGRRIDDSDRAAADTDAAVTPVPAPSEPEGASPTLA
jgi:O-antigen ligase